MENLSFEHWLGPLMGRNTYIVYSATDFVRGGGNTPKGIYNQIIQLMFRQWLGGVNAKAF